MFWVHHDTPPERLRSNLESGKVLWRNPERHFANASLTDFTIRLEKDYENMVHANGVSQVDPSTWALGICLLVYLPRTSASNPLPILHTLTVPRPPLSRTTIHYSPCSLLRRNHISCSCTAAHTDFQTLRSTYAPDLWRSMADIQWPQGGMESGSVQPTWGSIREDCRHR